ncbi:hypothetical protein [Thermogymnomonas acidicola]|nr:hypothetical protein [Thermogymnomonas acidicola]
MREFFASLVPRVRDMESYEAMARHFLHIDPFRNRQNSPPTLTLTRTQRR